jgi:tetratricopeptide (TPR) repeat protein
MVRGGPGGTLPPRRPDDVIDDLTGEGIVMDQSTVTEVERAASGHQRQRGGEQSAAARDESGIPLHTSDLILDEDHRGRADSGRTTDERELPETGVGYRAPAGPVLLPVAHRPTERLSAQEAAAQYVRVPPASTEELPLAALPTLIYRDAAAPQVRVLVVRGNDRGREFELTSDEVTIGRGTECDIVLADIAVSRRHLVLFRDGVFYRCRDLRSGNGTMVNGRKVEETPLVNGDQIEIGNTVLRFVVIGDAAVAPPAAVAAPPPGYTPVTVPPAYAAPAPAHGQVPPRARAGAVLPPAAHRARDPSPAAYLTREPSVEVAPAVHDAPGSYTPIVTPRTRHQQRGPQPVAAVLMSFGPLTRLMATRQGKLITFGSLGLAFVLVLAVVVKRVVAPKQGAAMATGVAGKAGAQLAPVVAYEDGVRKFREADWEGARASFAAVLRQVPDFQGAKKYAERCDVEIRSRDQLAAAKTALEKNDFAAARTALKEVDPAAKVGDEGIVIGRMVALRQVEFLLAAAKKLQAEADFAGAKAKLEQALAVQPDHAGAVVLRAELERASPTTEKEHGRGERFAVAVERAAARDRASAERRARPEVTRTVRDERTRTVPEAKRQRDVAAPAQENTEPDDDRPQLSGPVSDRMAMQHYRVREWGMAIATLKQLASKQKGKQQQKTLATAEEIRKVGQAFNRAEGQAGTNPAAAIGLYEQAASLDRHIGKGVHGPYLSGKLSRLSRAEAQQALQDGRYEQAYSLVKTAQRHGGDDATTRSVTQALDNKARDMFERAHKLKGQRPDEAKSLWRRVLKMVPPSSQWYVKSYRYLNEAAGARPRDEDE